MTLISAAGARARRHPDQIRVLSIPAGHVYVRHLQVSSDLDGVVRLPDPIVSPSVPPSQWWPPPALDAQWIAAHHREFDIFHLHFGFDARSADQLLDLVDALRRFEKPLVYTAHDLRNPHHEDRRLHDEALDVIIPAADSVLTLTPGAARQIDRRWGRAAEVLPHPHVVDEPTLSRPRVERPDFVIGLHLKSLRPSMDPLGVLDVLMRTVPELAGACVRVDVHNDVMTSGFDRFDPDVAEALRRAADEGTIQLVVHDFFTDDELWDYLQNLDVSVLPYRFGTHSGWLEACHDLGTTVLAPDCGYFAEQRPCLSYHLDESGLDESSLVQALKVAYHERPSWRAVPEERRQERLTLAQAHRALYEQLLT